MGYLYTYLVNLFNRGFLLLKEIWGRGLIQLVLDYGTEMLKTYFWQREINDTYSNSNFNNNYSSHFKDKDITKLKQF